MTNHPLSVFPGVTMKGHVRSRNDQRLWTHLLCRENECGECVKVISLDKSALRRRGKREPRNCTLKCDHDGDGNDGAIKEGGCSLIHCEANQTPTTIQSTGSETSKHKFYGCKSKQTSWQRPQAFCISTLPSPEINKRH